MRVSHYSWLPLVLHFSFSCSLQQETEAVPNCDPREIFYQDQDADGLGTALHIYIGCDAPEGFVTDSGDCDDSNPNTMDCPDTGSEETGL